MKIMDTDKPRFSFRWMPRSVEDVASGKYIGDTISCTDGRGTMLIFTITGRYEVELAECKGVATDGRVTIPYAIPFLFRYEENELRLSFRVVSIGESAFSKYLCSSSLKEIIIPDSVTSIREGSFERCRSLARIDIPESVTTIGGKAFKDCESLKEIIIPGSVTSIGMGAFSGCGVLEEISVDSDNPVYDSRDNCNAIIETAIGRLVQGCTATVIPESVTSIGDAAFSRCKALREIRIPVSVESIGNGAFNNCGIEKISFATTKDSVIEQDKTKCLTALKSMLPAIQEEWKPQDCPLYRHLHGSETNSFSERLFDMMKNEMESGNDFSFLSDNPEYQQILEELKGRA